jgi:branched-chain amino acid transport system permease protein
MKPAGWMRRGLVVLIGVVAVTLPLYFPQYYIQLTTRSLIVGIAAMSFILLAGYGGMISLAQMAFFAMAGYVIAIGTVDLQWPALLEVPLAVLAAILLSSCFGLIAIRAQGNYFLMMTLALGSLFYGLALQWASVTHGYNGISGITRPLIFGYSLRQMIPLYYTTIVVTALCYLLLRHLIHSRFGLVLQGVRDNPKRMTALGYNVQLHRFLVIVISGAVAGVAGILGVYFQGGVSPHTSDLSASILVVLAALLGGVARLEGGLVGAVITVFLLSFLSQYTQRYWTFVGAIFVLVVMFMPNGLLGSRLKISTRAAGRSTLTSQD